MWLKYLHSKEALELFYQDQVYANTIELRRISFEDRETKLEFDLQEWPNYAPRKWIDKKFNTVQVTIILTSCLEIHLKDWAMDNIGEFRVKKIKETELYSFKFISPSGAYFSCTCDILFCSKVSAYQKGATPISDAACLLFT